MNFFTWERKYGKQYAEMVDSGDISDMPAFKISSRDELSDKITDIIKNRLETGKSIMEIAPIICEYLYEVYHITPTDTEIISQYIMLGTAKMMIDMSEKVGKAIGERLLKGDDDDADQ